MNENIVLTGLVDKLIYENGDFRIYSFYPNPDCINLVQLSKFNNISISGQLPELYKGIEYMVEVEYVKKGNYDNYIVKRLRKVKNEITEEDSNTFLRAILTDYQYKSVMESYPDLVDRVINNKPIDLSLIHGIKEKKFEKIKDKILKNFKFMELVEEYFEYGMTMSMIERLYEAYSSIDKIKEMMEINPYECLCKLNRVAFKTADEIILKKFPHMSETQYRLSACIMQILRENESTGDTYMKMTSLYKKVKELAPECSHHFKSVLTQEEDSFYFNELEEKISMRSTYLCELEVSEIIKRKLLINKVLDIDYRKFNTVDSIPLSENQLEALHKLCRYNLSILAGVAGSGKSFSVKAILNMLDSKNISYTLIAPTGKSAKVLSQYCKKKAKTIHRELIYDYNGFVHNEDNPLSYDVVIVDEYSMIDIFLLRSLLQAIDDDCKILFIGDPEQLPSVGVGNISFDMLQSGVIPVTMLTEVFRFKEGGLSYVASKAREGEHFLDESKKGVQVFGINKDYTFVNSAQEDTFKYIRTIYQNLLSKNIPIDDIMVLSSMNKGEYGTIAFNALIQEMVNPNKENEVKVKRNDREMSFRVNDKVIQIKNNYKAEDENGEEKSVFNGDIGTIVGIQKDIVYVQIDNEIIIYDREDLNGLDLAYAISIHKSQGSSSKYVIVATPKAHKFFLNRNLLYVALTRGKEKVYHISTFDVVKSALRKSANFSRNTYLKEMLLNQHIA